MAGQQFGSNVLPFSYNTFTGGLNTFAKFDLVGDTESPDCSNVQGTIEGAIVKRGGFQTVATLTNPITSIHLPEQEYMLAADDTAGTLIRVQTDTGALLTLKSGLTTGTRWSWLAGPAVAGQGGSYGMDGINTPQQWNSNAGTTTGNWTATDAGGTVPDGSMCIYFQNQAFVTGVLTNPSRVYWSGFADPTAWNPANLNGSGFMDFDPSDGYAITGIGVVGPYILVFKATKTWVIVDTATATARRLSATIGCTSFRSITETPEGTFFLGPDRIYVTNGSKITPVSDKVQPTIDSNPLLLRPGAAGCYHGGHYYLSLNLTNGSTNDTILDWDTHFNSWWKHSIGVNDWAVREKGGLFNPVPYAANASSAFISRGFQSGIYQDNGSNFTWQWTTPWQSPSFYRRRRFPTMYYRKRMRQLRILGSGKADLSIAKDFGALTTWGTDIFSNSSTNTEKRVYGQGVARAWQLKFSGSYNSPGEVDEYVYSLVDRRDQLP